MADYMTLEEIEKESANESINANELDVLVSKTRELTILRERELNKLKDLHEDLQRRLKDLDRD